MLTSNQNTKGGDFRDPMESVVNKILANIKIDHFIEELSTTFKSLTSHMTATQRGLKSETRNSHHLTNLENSLTLITNDKKKTLSTGNKQSRGYIILSKQMQVSNIKS